jgi:hypothetical protein
MPGTLQKIASGDFPPPVVEQEEEEDEWWGWSAVSQAYIIHVNTSTACNTKAL